MRKFKEFQVRNLGKLEAIAEAEALHAAGCSVGSADLDFSVRGIFIRQ